MKRASNLAVTALLGGRMGRNFWLWSLPLAFFVGAFVLALVMLQVDRAVYEGRLSLPRWALGGGAAEAQAVLTVVAGASVTAVTLVFSSALVVLTLAASQFGSYLLGDFVRLRISRLTLSMFVATFVYAMTVLTRVGTGPSQQFVPEISAKVAAVLAVLSVAILTVFIYSISVAIQVQQVAGLVAGHLRRAIAERQHATAIEGGAGGPDDPIDPDLEVAIGRLEDHRWSVAASSTGYLQTIAYRRLTAAAQRARAVVRLAYRPGQFVLAESTLADVWPAEAADDGLADEIRSAHCIGRERTLEQDLEFAIDKLVQIALLALSPAINNTFNALICIDWLADALRMLAEHPSESLVHRDAAGAPRILTPPLPITALVQAAFTKIRRAGATNPAVATHLLETYARLAPWFTRPAQQAALRAQADTVAQAAFDSVKVEADRVAVTKAFERTCAILDGTLRRGHGGVRPSGTGGAA